MVAQVESGQFTQLWLLPYEPYQHFCTPSWTTLTWRDCSAHGITLLTDLDTLQPLWSKDVPLTTLFLQFTKVDLCLRYLNWCRLFLQVTSLAEILDASCSHLRPNMWNLDRKPTKEPRTGWPFRPTPNKDARKIWARFLKEFLHVSSRYLSLSPTPNLGDPLFDQWEWIYSPREEALYHKLDDGSYQRHNRLPGKATRRARNTFNRTGAPLSHCPRGLPAVVVPVRRGLQIQGASGPSFPPPAPITLLSPLNPLPAFLAEYSPTEAWLWDDVVLPDNWLPFLADLQTEEITLVSDGSYEPKTGVATAGVVLWVNGQYLSLSVLSPGRSVDQSAYRGEIVGVYAGLHLLKALWSHYSLPRVPVRMGLDGKHARLNSFESTHINWEFPSWDLLMANRQLISEVKEIIELSHFYVRGHQNKGCTVLGLEETLNTWADEIAGVRRLQAERMDNPFIDRTISGGTWILCIDGIRCVNNCTEAIKHRVDGKPLLDKVQAQRFPNISVDLIDWKPLGAALQELQGTERRWIAQGASRNAPVGVNMLVRKHWTNDKCPRCGAQETHHHILHCPEAPNIWARSVRRLYLWLLQQRTDPALADVLRKELLCWHSYKEPTHRIPLRLKEAINQQRLIGWDETIYGCFSKLWAPIQDKYYRSINDDRSGSRWLTQLVKKIWMIAWDQWEHRNGVLHDDKAIRTRAKLYSDVRVEYLRGCTDFRKSAKALFQTPLQDLLTRKQHYLEHWLARVQSERNQLNNDPNIGILRRQRALMERWSGLVQASAARAPLPD